MEEVLKYLTMYAPAIVAIITTIVSFLSAVGQCKKLAADKDSSIKALKQSLTNVLRENQELKNEITLVEVELTKTIQTVKDRNESLADEITELVRNLAATNEANKQIEGTKKELNQIKKQLALILKDKE